MGIFKKMAKAFLSGFPTHPRKEQMRDLLYPEALPNFQRLAADNHRDKRALTYTLRGIDTKRKDRLRQEI